jgi:hypothetical protein
MLDRESYDHALRVLAAFGSVSEDVLRGDGVLNPLRYMLGQCEVRVALDLAEVSRVACELAPVAAKVCAYLTMNTHRAAGGGYVVFRAQVSRRLDAEDAAGEVAA